MGDDKALINFDPQALSVVSNVAKTAAATGTNNQSHAVGELGTQDHQFHQNAGVYGESNQQGVYGRGMSPGATGVFGGNVNGEGFEVRGETATGIAIQGQSFGSGLAGNFIGDVHVMGHIHGDGDMSCTGKVTAFDDR